MHYTQPTVHLDFETGGLDPLRSPILSVSCYLVDLSGECLLEHHDRCRFASAEQRERADHPQHRMRLSDRALQVNKLDPNEGIDEEEFYANLMEFFANVRKQTGELPAVTAYNAAFDSAFLSALCTRHTNNPFAFINTICAPMICTQQMASIHAAKVGVPRKHIKKPGSTRASFSLEAVYYWLFGEAIDSQHLHGAAADAMMSGRVFNYLINYDYASVSRPH